MTSENNCRRFDGKVVVITGGAMGLGRAAAEAFSAEGAAVVIGDIDDDAVAQTVAALEARGGRAAWSHCDVRKSAEVQQLMQVAADRFGGIDVLYNSAGVVRYGTVEELTEEDWDYQVDINLKGSFLTCKYAVPEMRKRGGGSIVNTASVQAFASQKPSLPMPRPRGCGQLHDHGRSGLRP